MPVRNSKMKYLDTLNYRAFDLAKVGVPDIPVLYFVRHTKRTPAIEPHHHKGCFEIGLCLRGSLILENNGVQHTVLAGGIFFNKPEDAHRLLDYPKGTVLYGMLIKTKSPNGTLLRFTRAESTEIRNRFHQLPAHLMVNTNQIKHDFIELFRAYGTLQGRYRTLCMTATCMNLVTSLLETPRQEPPPSHADRIGIIIAAIQQEPGKLYDIDSLAYQAALSPSHFINQFKRLTGLPPHHFLLKCRLDEAKLRLRKTRLPVTRIAQDLGFCTSQHFSTHFKRATGMKPLAWRKQ
ncbi:MAG: AraC family transcriptional regulator [Kiritimatiellae bacterium]|nr:AraC family transcriptional regulator [Kiritimatiellia bacterium]MDD5519258.1 AraC family transcriptional regulator [Kiritimatiellia bacterium]